MISKKKSIVTPMLISVGLMRNFWGGMSSDFWFSETTKYTRYARRKMRKCINVPLVLRFILTDLKSKNVSTETFDPRKLTTNNPPSSHMIALALSAKEANLNMTVCDEQIYGFYIPTVNSSKDKMRMLANIMIKTINYDVSLMGYILSHVLYM